MRILHYLPYSYHIHSGWLEKIAQTIAEWLRDQHDVETLIVASDIQRAGNKKNLSDYDDTLFIPSRDLIYNFPFPKFWKKAFRQHFRTIKTFKLDIIITHTRFFVQSFVGGLIAKWLKIKRIHIEHGSGFVTGYPRYTKTCARLFDWTIGLRIFRQCDEVVTISQVHKSFIQKFTHKDPVVIYNPIDYSPQAKIKNDIPHIGFIGRLVPLKGVDLLIHALSQLQDRERICTIVWDGSEREKLENLAASVWLTGRINFVWTDGRENRLHKFDIFINPSHQEWLPTTVVEALLAKCVVVATDVGGTREISDQDDLILVHDTVESIQGWIEVAFNSLDQSGASYEVVKEQFGVKESINSYFNVCKHILWW